jgi:hypothetical protein
MQNDPFPFPNKFGGNEFSCFQAVTDKSLGVSELYHQELGLSASSFVKKSGNFCHAKPETSLAGPKWVAGSCAGGSFFFFACVLIREKMFPHS